MGQDRQNRAPAFLGTILQHAAYGEQAKNDHRQRQNLWRESRRASQRRFQKFDVPTRPFPSLGRPGGLANELVSRVRASAAMRHQTRLALIRNVIFDDPCTSCNHRRRETLKPQDTLFALSVAVSAQLFFDNAHIARGIVPASVALRVLMSASRRAANDRANGTLPTALRPPSLI